LRVISGQKEQFFVRLIYKLIEGGEVMGEITVTSSERLKQLADMVSCRHSVINDDAKCRQQLDRQFPDTWLVAESWIDEDW